MSGLAGNQDMDIDLGRLFSAVWERRGRILGSTVLAAGLAFVGASLAPPSYRGETRILIESRSPNLSGTETPASANDPVLDALNVTSQAQLLQSTDLIKEVARDLKLHELKEFDPDAQSMLPNPLVLLGLQQNPLELAPEERVLKAFREKLEVYPVENSRVIAIEFSSHDPKLAAAIPNKMADVYLSLQSGAKLDTHSETARWLEPEIASLTEKVREAEKKVADYRSSAGLFQTTETSSFSAQQLNDISTELARVRAERANAEARAENVRAALEAGRDSDTLGDVVGSQVIQRLKEAEANLQAQVSDQSTALLENHPRLKGLRAQLAGIRRQIESETQKILGSLNSEAEVARLREQQLIQQLNGLKADSARAGEEEVGLRALEREAAAQRQLLETYLARYREAASQLDRNSSPADARIVSSAVEPSEPYFPKVGPIVIVVALATLIIGAIVAMLRELFSGRALRPSEDEETVEIAPAIGAANAAPVVTQPEPVQAAAHFDHQEIAGAGETGAGDPVSPEVEESAEEEQARQEAGQEDKEEDAAFSIRSVSQYLLRYDIPLAIAVSPAGDSGSTATVMLARDVAESGRTVVLLDMTGSACPTRLMAESARLPGITDLLCGETAFGDAIHRDRLSDAHVIPHGTADAGRAMRGADRLTMIVDALCDAYDLVLVECGPAEMSGLSRLTRAQSAEVILSVPEFEEADIAALVGRFEEAGYRNLLVMSGLGEGRSPSAGRNAAA
ncbi:exopolysaccharide transport family protein [Rhizobium sp. LC145]|uniref:exopolysaccharide transport family protein n=1 Tax=Rhizobium sp. LC145 TaxID=1120688 RepID=UPI00062A4D05|nr:exopolysaccharide transport family protein [Rhizobium sp. LC145]KKX34310.1 chain-length determining protein [Rhizobium sp. LC145]TKT65560.1 chain-length determining protein [Rhizobiaceae bacterium LC148]